MSLSNSKKLQSLTAAAIALPGIGPVQAAEEPPEDHTVALSFTRYVEDSIDASVTSTGTAVDRYEIEISQASYRGAISDKVALSIDYAADVMAGATPWYVRPRTALTEITDATPVQVMSSASILDIRRDYSVGARVYNKTSNYGGFLRYSDENDYSAITLGMEYSKERSSKLATWLIGSEYSSDSIKPTQTAGEIERVTAEDKKSFSLYGGYTQIVNRVTSLQIGGSFTRHSGYLSDPYKKSWVFDPDTSQQKPYQDLRPDARNQYTLTAQLRRYLKPRNAAVHFNYRFYFDDWELSSHTFQLRLIKSYGHHWQVIPGVRLYSQGEADFYATYYVKGLRADGFRSSDYRLSSFGSISASLKVIKKLEHWKLSVYVERYSSEESLGLNSVELSNPGLVNFTRFSFGISHILF